MIWRKWLKAKLIEILTTGEDEPIVWFTRPGNLHFKQRDELEMKCIVKNCKNHTHQGQFVGDMCLPCYQFITTGQGRYSQVYRNAAVLESEECAKIADRYVGCEQISASIRARVNKHEL